MFRFHHRICVVSEFGTEKDNTGTNTCLKGFKNFTSTGKTGQMLIYRTDTLYRTGMQLFPQY